MRTFSIITLVACLVCVAACGVRGELVRPSDIKPKEPKKQETQIEQIR